MPAFFKTLSKLFAFAILGLVVLLVLVTGLFYLFRHQVKAEVVRLANSLQSGEFAVAKVDLSPFSHLPYVSLRLNQVTYYERKTFERESSEQPICALQRFYVAFDVIDLLQGEINVRKVTLDGGEVTIVTHSDSTVNLINALRPPKDEKVRKEASGTPEITIPADTQRVEPDTSRINLRLDQVTLKNLALHFDNRVSDRKTDLYLHELNSSLVYVQDSVDCRLVFALDLLRLQKGKRTLIENKSLEADLDFGLALSTLSGEVRPSALTFANAKFRLEGEFDLSNDGFVDLKLEASDQGLGWISKLLREDAIAKIFKRSDHGQLYFKGMIKGKTANQFPFVEFEFGARDIHLEMPEGVEPVEQLNFSGYFTTGEQQDFSQARLELAEVKARLPGGNLQASFRVNNFVRPQIELACEAKSEIVGYDKVFDLGETVDSLSGVVSIKSAIRGVIAWEEQRFLPDTGETVVTLENVALRFPQTNQAIDGLSGRLRHFKNRLELDSLQIKSGNSGAVLNGSLTNLAALLFGWEAPLSADLQIAARKLRLAEDFAFDSTLAATLGDEISNLRLALQLHTSTAALVGSDSLRQMNVIVRHLSGDFGNLPKIENGRGEISVVEDTTGFKLGLTGVQIKTSSGGLNYTGRIDVFAAPQIDFDGKVALNDVTPRRLLNELGRNLLPNDTTLFLDGTWSASATVKAQVALAPFAVPYARLSNGIIKNHHKLTGDFINVFGLDLKVDGFTIDLDDTTRRLPSMRFDGGLAADSIRTQYFILPELHAEATGREKIFEIRSTTNGFWGGQWQGRIKLDFSREASSYDIQGEANGVRIEEMLEHFDKSKMMRGDADFRIAVSTSGKGWDDFRQTIDGEVSMRGEDIIISGFDLDNFLAKFAKTQRFSLVDVGAFTFAGPAGVAATKSVNYAELLTTGAGQQTDIPQLVFSWQLKKGAAKAEDVALVTRRSRIAIKGEIDFAQEQFRDLAVAVLDKNGCALISQTLSGSFDHPQTGSINVVGALLAPVINVFKKITLTDCKPIYTGTLAHPQ